MIDIMRPRHVAREPIRECRTLPSVRVQPDDAEHWRRAIAGEGDAFAAIFDRHRSRVLRHSLRLVPTASDADDIVAITFMEAWRRRRTVRFVDGSVLPWLLVTATNVSHNVRRSSRR